MLKPASQRGEQVQHDKSCVKNPELLPNLTNLAIY